MDAIAKIKGCIEVERLAVYIYKTFNEQFPEESDIWSMLAKEEQEHEDIFRLALEHGAVKEHKDEEPLPPLLSIKRTLDYLSSVLSNITVNRLSLEEAFKTALLVEETKVEAYLNDLMEEASLKKTRKMFGQVLEKERTHIDKLAKRMNEIGIRRDS